MLLYFFVTDSNKMLNLPSVFCFCNYANFPIVGLLEVLLLLLNVFPLTADYKPIKSVEQRSGMVTFHLCLVTVLSVIVIGLRVDHLTVKFTLVALLQALYLKDHRVGGPVCQRDLAAVHAARIYGVAEILVVGAEDVEAA